MRTVLTRLVHDVQLPVTLLLLLINYIVVFTSVEGFLDLPLDKNWA